MFWILRIAESALLLGMVAGIILFGWSLIDIVRIESGISPDAVPPLAWPAIATFGGSLLLLQFVRIALHRYRRDDGTPRDDVRAEAATATAEVLATTEKAGAEATDTGNGA